MDNVLSTAVTLTFTRDGFGLTGDVTAPAAVRYEWQPDYTEADLYRFVLGCLCGFPLFR